MRKPKKSKPSSSVARKGRSPLEKGKNISIKGFTIVGIGASAGGLEAFMQLLRDLPADIGMSFIFVQHLDPTHESHLTGLMSRVTKMEVSELRDGDAVKPNHVYIIPPNTDIEITDGKIKVIAGKKVSRGVNMPIDYFFRSLAVDQKSKAIGIVLSGTGTDGTLGIQEIKEQGGITFVQEEKSAKYDGMPHSAILSGFADFILPIDGITEELKRIMHHPYVSPVKKETKASKDEKLFKEIFQMLRKQKEVDFSHYKPKTLERRIMRRMAVNKTHTLADYVKLLREKPEEVHALFQDILIKVTSFFRDPATFQALKTKVFPELIKNRRESDQIRIWVAGCATGEEAYSIAICLLEFLDRKTSYPIQIFATDISEWAIEKARAGKYVQNIA